MKEKLFVSLLVNMAQLEVKIIEIYSMVKKTWKNIKLCFKLDKCGIQPDFYSQSWQRNFYHDYNSIFYKDKSMKK